MKRVLSIIVALWAVVTSQAQDLSGLEKMYQTLKECSTLAMNYEVWVQGEAQDPLVKEAEGQIRLNGEGYFTQYGDRAYLYCKQGLLDIDHTTHEMSFKQADAYQRVDQTNTPTIPDDLAETFRSLAEGAHTVELVSKDVDQIHYRFSQPEAGIIRTDIFIDAESFLPERISYQYHADTEEEDFVLSRMEIRYTKVSTSRDLPDVDLTSLRHYLQGPTKKCRPTPEFADYKLTLKS